MSIRVINSAVNIRPSQWINHTRFFQFGHQGMPRRMKSIALTNGAIRKIFEENRFIDSPPKGWRERFIVIQNKREGKMESEQQDTKSTTSMRNPMSFEEFKKAHLFTFDEYKKRLNVSDNLDEIKKAYNIFCESNYQGYLIKFEQISPGTIL